MDTGSTFVEAWNLSRTFWMETLIAFARHPAILLLYAAPPAVERAWTVLRNKPVAAWWLPSLEALVVIWRLMMAAVAVWIMLTPMQLVNLRKTFSSNSLVQAKLAHLGQNMGNHLWVLSWQILFFAIVFLGVVWLFDGMARLWTRGRDVPQEQTNNQRLAVAAVARNLLLYPLSLMYAVALARYYLET
jgi:hypothetical protein